MKSEALMKKFLIGIFVSMLMTSVGGTDGAASPRKVAIIANFGSDDPVNLGQSDGLFGFSGVGKSFIDTELNAGEFLHKAGYEVLNLSPVRNPDTPLG